MNPHEYARLQGVPDFPLVGTTIQQLWGFPRGVRPRHRLDRPARPHAALRGSVTSWQERLCPAVRSRNEPPAGLPNWSMNPASCRHRRQTRRIGQVKPGRGKFHPRRSRNRPCEEVRRLPSFPRYLFMCTLPTGGAVGRKKRMSDPHQKYEIRCPVHGFIPIDDWEREIINHRAFQRLRRIRQLASDGSGLPRCHAHPIRAFAGRNACCHPALRRHRGKVKGGSSGRRKTYTDGGFMRDRRLVRLAATLHDVGHSPFSHGGEDLFPMVSTGGSGRYRHENYSAAIIRTLTARGNRGPSAEPK